MLDQWGYPYVMDEFHFHITLTGPDPDDMAEPQVRQQFGDWDNRELTINQLALMGEREDGLFEVIQRQPLG